MSSQPISSELSQIFTDAIFQVSGKRVGALTAEQPIAQLGLDSIAVMEMVGTLEEKLSVHFNDDELTKLNTMGDLAALVERYRSASKTGQTGTATELSAPSGK